ncbi:MAG: response regulator transcription factor [Bryobacterales bacterium]|nr:response regulator transcription factor [Bryobacterales bacterium]
MAAITLFAYESQPIVIEGLHRILETDPEIQLLGAASTPSEALPQILRLQPQIVLLDQSGGLKSVFRFLSDLKAAFPGALPVLWVTELAEVESFRALQLGARGILKRTLPIAAILDCLHAVAKGNIWIEHHVSNHVVGFLNRRQIPRLTPREREIVRCLCRGMRNKEIADELSITPGTVKVHLMHIFEKTGVKDRFELAVHGRNLLGLEAGEEQNSSPLALAGEDIHGDY